MCYNKKNIRANVGNTELKKTIKRIIPSIEKLYHLKRKVGKTHENQKFSTVENFLVSRTVFL